MRPEQCDPDGLVTQQHLRVRSPTADSAGVLFPVFVHSCATVSINMIIACTVPCLKYCDCSGWILENVWFHCNLSYLCEVIISALCYMFLMYGRSSTCCQDTQILLLDRYTTVWPGRLQSWPGITESSLIDRCHRAGNIVSSLLGNQGYNVSRHLPHKPHS